MRCNLRVLTDDVRDHCTAHIERRVHLVVHDALGHRIHGLPGDIDDDNPLNSRLIHQTRFDRPPIRAQVEDLLVLVPVHQVIRAGVRNLDAARIRIDVLLLFKGMGRHNRNAGVKLQREHFELEAWSRNFESDIDGAIVYRLDFLHKLVKCGMIRQLFILHLPFKGVHHVLRRHGRPIAPGGFGPKLDLECREVLVGVLHALS